MRFNDRVDAGRQLAAELRRQRPGNEDVTVLALPRGGVPVAFEVAQGLFAPLDVIVVRKLGVPFQPELAMGAVGEGGVCVLDGEVLHVTGVKESEIAVVQRRERAEIERWVGLYGKGRSRVPISGRTAVIVDDGMATGSTARAACQVARAKGANHVVVAVPVASAPALARLSDVSDQVVCLQIPDQFYAVGEWYRDFSPTSDEEVVALLDRAASRMAPPPPSVRGDPRARKNLDE